MNQKEPFGNNMEALMQHYREELLRYQRATPPGRSTLGANLKGNAPPSAFARKPSCAGGGCGEKKTAEETAAAPGEGPVPAPAPEAAPEGGHLHPEPPSEDQPAPGPPPRPMPTPPAAPGEGPVPLPTPEPPPDHGQQPPEPPCEDEPASGGMDGQLPPPLPEPAPPAEPTPPAEPGEGPAPLPTPEPPPDHGQQPPEPPREDEPASGGMDGQLPPWGPPPCPEPAPPAAASDGTVSFPTPEAPPSASAPDPMPPAPEEPAPSRPLSSVAGWTPDVPFWPIPSGGGPGRGYQPVVQADELEDMLADAERRALNRPPLSAELGPEALAIAAAASGGRISWPDATPRQAAPSAGRQRLESAAPARNGGPAAAMPAAPVPAQPSRPAAGSAPGGDCKPFTTSWGMPIDGDQHVMTAGQNGFALLQDLHFIDKIQHFTRERIPERVVHAKGAGAFGRFRVYQPMSAYTTAAFLQDPNETTDVFVRFSLAGGPKGGPDTARDIRGFATKFYTRDGIYDIVGNHIPVFLVDDAMKFPDVIHAIKPDPRSNLRNIERFFDFVSLTPEATNALIWLYSDLGTVRSFRRINGYGINTFVWVNADGKRVYVKYHWLTQQGLETIDRLQAEELAGSDPDVACRDLYTALMKGETASYELCVQMMELEKAGTLEFDPLDCTKIWPEDRFPLIRVGLMTLDRAPDNYFAQVEQACFSPSNLVPGIEFSADKMLQGRSFAYSDAARYRVGTNFNQLPINRSRSAAANHQQDGRMAFYYSSNPVNYSPNSLDGNCPEVVIPAVPGMEQHGAAGRYGYGRVDNFTQAGDYYRALSEEQQRHLVDNLAEDLGDVNAEILGRVIGMLAAADADLGRMVQKAVNRPVPRR